MNGATTCICFDFDGTIADSYHLFREKVQGLALKLGYRPISDEQAEQLRNKHVRDIIAQFKIPYYRVPWLVWRLRAEMRDGMRHVPPVEGMPGVIASLRERRYLLGIVSSNTERIVHDLLDAHRLQLFDFIACNANIFGKVRTLSWVLWRRQLPPERTVYIGDEMRDAEAARKIGIRFGAVSWGYNTLESLRCYDPEYVFEAPNDILAAFPGPAADA